VTPEQKDWIDNASYEQLLHKWRFTPAGDPFFSVDVGPDYEDVMQRKKQAVDYVAAPKRLGWDVYSHPITLEFAVVTGIEAPRRSTREKRHDDQDHLRSSRA